MGSSVMDSVDWNAGKRILPGGDSSGIDWATGERELPAKEVGGFKAAAKQAIGSTIKGAGQVAADFIPFVGQDNAVKRYGESVIDANPTAVQKLSDITDKPLTAVTEATGNAVGSLGAMAATRAAGMGITAASPLAGPAAPAVAAIGQGIAWLGPMAIAALPSFGGIRDKQIINDPASIESAKSKAIAALGAGTVGLIETKFGPTNWALAAFTKEGRAELAKKFAATTLPRAVGKGIALGSAVEGAEELVQSPIEQLASGDNPLTKESLLETAHGAAMGAIGGGVLGGAFGGILRTQPPTTTAAPPESIGFDSGTPFKDRGFHQQVQPKPDPFAGISSDTPITVTPFTPRDEVLSRTADTVLSKQVSAITPIPVYAREQEAITGLLEKSPEITPEDRQFLLDSGFAKERDDGVLNIMPSARRRALALDTGGMLADRAAIPESVNTIATQAGELDALASRAPKAVATGTVTQNLPGNTAVSEQDDSTGNFAVGKNTLPTLEGIKPVASKEENIDRYQWQANVEGGQQHKQTIQPLTKKLFNRHVKSTQRKELRNFAVYRERLPENTHISLIEQGNGRITNPTVGSREALRPTGDQVEKGLVKPVESFLGAKATGAPVQNRGNARQNQEMKTLVDFDIIDSESGDVVGAKLPADEALAQIDNDIDKTKGLLKCLLS